MKTTKEIARRLTVEKQEFTSRPGTVTKDEVYQIIDRLGCLQIDTINVVERAHHLTLWSRLGPHEKSLLNELAYDDRRLFEYWAHAACYVPMEDHRFFISPMRMREGEMLERLERWGGRAGGVNPGILDEVLERVKADGPLATKDFEQRRTGPSKGWWDWKPAKVALEVLYGARLVLYRRDAGCRAGGEDKDRALLYPAVPDESSHVGGDVDEIAESPALHFNSRALSHVILFVPAIVAGL